MKWKDKRGKLSLFLVFILLFSLVASSLVMAETIDPDSQMDGVGEELNAQKPLPEEPKEEPEVTQESLEESDPVVEEDEEPEKPEEPVERKEPKESKPEQEPLEEEIVDPSIPANPDGLSKPMEIDSPKIITYSPGQLGPYFGLGLKAMAMAAQNHPDDHNNIEPPAPGSLDIDKWAEPVEGFSNRWKITLTLEGKDIPTTSDIVLVMDRSGSMAGNRMTNAKAAANKFVDTLLRENSGTRIALVSFAGDVTTYSSSNPFIDESGAQSLKNAINGLNANGGTHTQAGIRQARELLNGSSAGNKSIVLLSDGEPTYSYGLNSTSLNSGNFTTSGDDRYTRDDLSSSAFNYGNSVGNGSNMTSYIGGSGFLGLFAPYRYYHHGNSAVSESNFAKSAGNTIYTIALNAGTDGNNVLNRVASPGNAYTGSESDLQGIFDEIAGSISYAATNARITDPMGEMFSIPGINSSNYMSHITVNRGTLSWDDTTETITWNLNTISEGNPATMSYVVEIDESAESGIVYPTNKHTYVDYTNAHDEDARKSFPIPEAGVNAGTIRVHYFRVNEDGQPINSQGEAITKEQAILESLTFREGENLELGTPYNVSGPATIVLGEKTYRYNSLGQGADPNPTEVTLTPQNPSRDIYFGYMEQSSVDVTVKKVVTGNFGDLSKEFDFTVTVKDETTNFSLAHNESEILEGLPADATLILTEEANDYDVTVMAGNDPIDPNADGSYTIILDGEDTTITVTNHKDTAVDVGISLDSLPYILMLTMAMGGLGVTIVRKRHTRNQD